MGQTTKAMKAVYTMITFSIPIDTKEANMDTKEANMDTHS